MKLKEWLATFLGSVGRRLNRQTARPSPSSPSEEIETEERSSLEVSGSEADQSQVDQAPLPWRLVVEAITSHIRSLLSDRPWVIGLAVGFVVLVYLFEEILWRAWSKFAGTVDALWTSLNADHTLALWVAGLVLFFLVFGVRWLRLIDDILRWARKTVESHKIPSALIVLFLLWLLNSGGRWVVLPFEVGEVDSIELDGRKAAIQLTTELGKVGTGYPTPAFIMYGPREPYTSTGSVFARRRLFLSGCNSVLRGPGEYVVRERIPLPRIITGSGSDVLNLGNLSVGSVSLPSDLVVRSILRIFPTGFREFSGFITESSGDLLVTVNLRSPAQSWSVAGPSDALDEIIEYLALRMALDLNPDVIMASGMSAPPEDGDLAYFMGVAEYREGNYLRARGLFRIADRFEPLRADIDAFLGLAQYRLPSEGQGGAAENLKEASQHFEAAVLEDPASEGSPFGPYLACLYNQAGMEEEAESVLRTFNSYLSALETRDLEVRTSALSELPFSGPSQHLSIGSEGVVFVDAEGEVVGSPSGAVTDQDLLLPGGSPRQVLVAGESELLALTSDGELRIAYLDETGSWKDEMLVEGPRLKGVQQVTISESRYGWTNAFLLDRFGNVYWCRLDLSVRECSPKILRATRSANVRQVFPVDDVFYFVAGDGAVWRAEIDQLGKADASRLLTQPATVREVFAAKDQTLYLLHDNGNLWRWREDGVPETEDLILIDDGTGTVQIFASGDRIYLLKGDGAVWRVSNAPDPVTEDFNRIWDAGDRSIQEISVLEDSPGSRTIYLLTADREVLVGSDSGVLTVDFVPIGGSTATIDPLSNDA